MTSPHDQDTASATPPPASIATSTDAAATEAASTSPSPAMTDHSSHADASAAVAMAAAAAAVAAAAEAEAEQADAQAASASPTDLGRAKRLREDDALATNPIEDTASPENDEEDNDNDGMSPRKLARLESGSRFDSHSADATAPAAREPSYEQEDHLATAAAAAAAANAAHTAAAVAAAVAAAEAVSSSTVGASVAATAPAADMAIHAEHMDIDPEASKIEQAQQQQQQQQQQQHRQSSSQLPPLVPATSTPSHQPIPELAPRSPSTSKRHKCPYCGTEFTRHHNLKSHLLTHSQEKPYVCQGCDMRFRRLHDLKRHSKLHTGEKPHICPHCDRKFARGDALARHSKGLGGCAGRRAFTGASYSHAYVAMGMSMNDSSMDDDSRMVEGEGDSSMSGVAYDGPSSAAHTAGADGTDDEQRRMSLPGARTQQARGRSPASVGVQHARTYSLTQQQQQQGDGGPHAASATRLHASGPPAHDPRTVNGDSPSTATTAAAAVAAAAAAATSSPEQNVWTYIESLLERIKAQDERIQEQDARIAQLEASADGSGLPTTVSTEVPEHVEQQHEPEEHELEEHELEEHELEEHELEEHELAERHEVRGEQMEQMEQEQEPVPVPEAHEDLEAYAAEHEDYDAHRPFKADGPATIADGHDDNAHEIEQQLARQVAQALHATGQ